MKKLTIHLDRPNTLSKHLKTYDVVSLKITGLIGKHDFKEELDYLCETPGLYDDEDNFIPDWDDTPALRHLDMGEATFVSGKTLPDFGSRTPLQTLILPKGFRRFGSDPGFEGSEMLTTVVFPEGLHAVTGFAFCPKLTGVVLPESIESIYNSAFRGCTSITSIRIPAKVKYMCGDSFAGCPIRAFEVDAANPYLTVVDGVIYNKAMTQLIAFPSAYPHKHFKVPEGVKVIGFRAFSNSQIEHIELPQGLTKIEMGAFERSKLVSISIPDSVESIEEYAFWFCQDLASVRLPQQLQELHKGTFWGCYSLLKIEIPASVKSIGHYALSLFCDLEEVVFHHQPDDPMVLNFLLHKLRVFSELSYSKTINILPWGEVGYDVDKKAYHISPNFPFKVIDGTLCL